ncbi:MAG: AAA family ATPase [Planctomycetia bacterium]
MPAAPARIDELAGVAAQLRSGLRQRIVGLDQPIDELLITLFAGGHALLEGVPGLAKTLVLSSLAELTDLSFSRIQFTPDLMPSDVTGSEYLVQDPATGQREFRFAPGPVFAHVVLADEVNRAPPKTQAALMEAMEERQVTSLGVSRRLEEPFVVLATQNPIEQEGTYPLPAAQLDRFLFKVHLGYPSFEQEAQIARLASRVPARLAPVLDRARFLALRDALRASPAPDEVVRYAVDLVSATRPQSGRVPARVADYVEWGAGPRAAQALVNASRARAALAGRVRADVEDVRALAAPVLRHRLVLSYAAQADGVDAEGVVARLVEDVPCPGRAPAPPPPGWLRRLWDSLRRPAPAYGAAAR